MIKKGEGGKKKKAYADSGKSSAKVFNLSSEVASCPRNITLPLAGMCGGGSSGSSGGVPVSLLSDFFLMFFLWAFGEELEELLELVTVSPELHHRKIRAAGLAFLFIKRVIRVLFI